MQAGKLPLLCASRAGSSSAAAPPISLARTAIASSRSRIRYAERGRFERQARGVQDLFQLGRSVAVAYGLCHLIGPHSVARVDSRLANSQIAGGLPPGGQRLVALGGHDGCVPAPCAAPSDPQYRGVWRKFNWPCIHSVQKVCLGHGKDSTSTTLVGSCDGFSTLHCDPPFGDTRTV